MDKTSALCELCTFHPDDPILHMQYANHLSDTGHEIAALYAARKAYNIFKAEHAPQAEKILCIFGDELLSSPTHPFPQADYRPMASHLGVIAAYQRKVTIKENETLFNKGEQADYAYLVLSGELSVNVAASEKFRMLNYVHPGALLGEGILHDNPQRTATVIANTTSMLLRFNAAQLIAAFEKHPDLYLFFSKEAMQRRYVSALSAAELFSRLPIDLRFIIAKRAWQESFAAGSIIKQPYKHMNNAALLCSGTIHLIETSKQESIYCGRLKAGEIIGAPKIMDPEPSSMTYVAETDCTMIYMDYTVIEDLMGISSWFSFKLKEMIERFNNQLNRTLQYHHSNKPK